MVKVGEWGDAVKKSGAWGGNGACTCLQVRHGDGFVIFVIVQHQDFMYNQSDR